MFEQNSFESIFAIPQRNGLTKPKRVRGKGIKMINMGELFSERIIHDLPMDRVPCTEKELASNKLEQGDLLFARQSLTLEGAGKSSIFVGDNEDVVFESHLIRCRLDKSKADPRYYFYFFESKFGKQRISSIVEQVAAAGIRGSDLVKLPVFIPPISEQKAIAHILGTLDDKIELNKKLNQTLEDIAKAIFKSWFVDFDPVRAKAEDRPTGLPADISDLFPDELVNSEIGEIPRGWETSIIGDFGNVICGKTPSTKDSKNFGGIYPFITIPDMRGNIISLTTERTVSEEGAKLLKGKLLPSGSICISCIATPGLVSVTTSDSFTNQQINSIVPHKDKQREYLALSMMTFGELISSAGSGGSVFANLSTGKFKELPILRPSGGIITCFSKIVRPMLTRIEFAKKEILTLTQLRDTLLPKLISGELRVPDAERFMKEASV